MADDARISTALPQHPKTVKLQRRLGAPGCWSLVCLFLWVADNRPQGDLAGMTAEDIEIAANWLGSFGDFVRTLADLRFLDGQEGTYTIHDWAEHNPWAANRPRRIEKARAAASARWEKRVAAQSNATSMQNACGEHKSAMPASPLLSSPPDTTKSSSSELASSDPGTGVCLTKKRERQPPSDKGIRLAQKLHDEIIKNKPDCRFTNSWLESWARTADLMMGRDGRTFERISALIGWVQGDQFWKTNILSMDKLREKFDELEMKARAQYEQQSARRPSDSQFVGPNPELPACAIGFCDGSGEYMDRSTHRRMTCACRESVPMGNGPTTKDFPDENLQIVGQGRLDSQLLIKP
jgi:hypothetical protein